MYITYMMSLACRTIHTTNPEEHQALVLPTQENFSNAEQAQEWLHSRGAHMGVFKQWNGNLFLSEDGGNHMTQQSRLGSWISRLCYQSEKADTLSPNSPYEIMEIVGGLFLNPMERSQEFSLSSHHSDSEYIDDRYLSVSLRSARAAVHIPLRRWTTLTNGFSKAEPRQEARVIPVPFPKICRNLLVGNS